MCRYDALSHNSYLRPIVSFDDTEDGAAYPSGAYTAENSMGRQTKRGPSLFGG